MYLRALIHKLQRSKQPNLGFLLEAPIHAQFKGSRWSSDMQGLGVLILTGSNLINLITMPVFKGSNVRDAEEEKRTSKRESGGAQL